MTLQLKITTTNKLKIIIKLGKQFKRGDLLVGDSEFQIFFVTVLLRNVTFLNTLNI